METKKIKMLKDDRGAPHGHTVVCFGKDDVVTVPVALAHEFITSGSAEEVVEASGPSAIISQWPPSNDEIENLTFSALGVLLEGKGVALGALKSEEARRSALRELIIDEQPAPWPASDDQGKVPDAKLAKMLREKGVDISTLKTREEAETKLRELMGITEVTVNLPSDEQIEALPDDALAAMLVARQQDLAHFEDRPSAVTKLKSLVADERAKLATATKQ